MPMLRALACCMGGGPHWREHSMAYYKLCTCVASRASAASQLQSEQNQMLAELTRMQVSWAPVFAIRSQNDQLMKSMKYN